MKRQFRKYIKPDYSSNKSETTPIYIRYDYDRSKRTFINTGHKIDPDLHWDFKRHTLKRSCPDYDIVLRDIENIENKISNILQYARQNQIDPTTEYLVDQLQTFKEILLDNNKQTDFFPCLPEIFCY